MTNANMIPLGYYIVRKSGKKARPSWVSPDYFTVAGCLCEGVIPGLESGLFNEDEISREWDLAPRDARRLYDFGQDHCAQINYELFHIFLDYDTPARICREFFEDRADVLIIGLCTTDTHFLESPGIRNVAPLPENAVLLGWDLYEYGDYVQEGEPLPPLDYHRHGTMGILELGCTFCCCDNDGALPKRLGVQLNSIGMYPDATSATMAANVVNKERLGEPCHYLPFALFRCDKSR
ncbi:MAG: hypothetical protein IJS08_00140 [Victivallales bacterium]|nr:hypothetical protein [Victivallales bacterium]